MKTKKTKTIHIPASSRMITFAEYLGERVRRKRLQLEMTMKTLGERSSVSQAYVWQIEHGTSRVSVEILFRIARVLAVTPQSLWRGW